MKENEILIRRSEKKNKFTIIDNKVFAQGVLSPQAIGVLCIVLHLPDGWVFRKSWMMDKYGISRRHLDVAFNELIKAGYVFEMDYIRSNDGEFNGKGYIFYDTPQTEITDVQVKPKEIEKPKTSALDDMDFLEFYQTYPKQMNIKKAKEEFKKLNAITKPLALSAVKQYATAVGGWSEDDKKYIPSPHTWLHDERYQDDPKTWTKTYKTNETVLRTNPNANYNL